MRRDDLGATLLKLQFEPDRNEWVTIKHEDKDIRINDRTVSKAWDYTTAPTTDEP